MNLAEKANVIRSLCLSMFDVVNQFEDKTRKFLKEGYYIVPTTYIYVLCNVGTYIYCTVGPRLRLFLGPKKNSLNRKNLNRGLCYVLMGPRKPKNGLIPSILPYCEVYVMY